MLRLLRLLILVVAWSVAAGCGKSADDRGVRGGRGEPGTSSAPPAPPPYTGPLTIDRIMAVKGAIRPFDDWARSLALVESRLGKPTRVRGAVHQWGVVAGDECAWFEMSKDNTRSYFPDRPDPTDVAGAVGHPTRVDRTGSAERWASCAAAAGGGAPGEPASGRAGEAE